MNHPNDVPDEPALVLVIHEVQSIAGPGFLDRLDVLFQRHLDEGVSNNDVNLVFLKVHLSLRLDDHFLD